MAGHDYYRILGLEYGCSAEDIKKAYREKARKFHPDINHAPDAMDMFIIITEAYEFLMTNLEKMASDQNAYDLAMEEWRKYRQDRSRQKARAFAQASYIQFRNTNFYKATRIFDGTTIISCLIVSIFVLIMSVYGYIYRLHNPIPGIRGPSVIILILFLCLGMVLFIASFVYLKAYINSSNKHKSQK